MIKIGKSKLSFEVMLVFKGKIGFVREYQYSIFPYDEYLGVDKLSCIIIYLITYIILPSALANDSCIFI